MKLFKAFAKGKNYFSQGNLYMAIANFFITMFTWLSVMKLGPVWYFLVPVFGMSIIILVGWIDFHYVKRHEIAHANTMSDMKDQLDRVELAVKALSKQSIRKH